MGSNNALPSHHLLPRLAKIEVRIGQTLIFEDLKGQKNNRILYEQVANEQVANRTMQAIAELQKGESNA